MNFRKYYSSRSSSNLNDSGSQLNHSLNGHNTNGHSNGHVNNNFNEHQNNNGKIDLNSDGSFTETDSGTSKSRPTSRINCKLFFFSFLFSIHKQN